MWKRRLGLHLLKMIPQLDSVDIFCSGMPHPLHAAELTELHWEMFHRLHCM